MDLSCCVVICIITMWLWLTIATWNKMPGSSALINCITAKYHRHVADDYEETKSWHCTLAHAPRAWSRRYVASARRQRSYVLCERSTRFQRDRLLFITGRPFDCLHLSEIFASTEHLVLATWIHCKDVLGKNYIGTALPWYFTGHFRIVYW